MKTTVSENQCYALTVFFLFGVAATAPEELQQQHSPTRSGGPQETTLAAEQTVAAKRTVAAEADARLNQPEETTLSVGGQHPSSASPSLPTGMGPHVPTLPQEGSVEGEHGQTVGARDRDARLEAALRRQQEQQEQRQQERRQEEED